MPAIAALLAEIPVIGWLALVGIGAFYFTTSKDSETVNNGLDWKQILALGAVAVGVLYIIRKKG